MTPEEANFRFNSLPREHRVTIIGNELNMEIRWLESEKRNYIAEHSKNIKRINDRIKRLENDLKRLND
jgi:hypothetical protein